MASLTGNGLRPHRPGDNLRRPDECVAMGQCGRATYMRTTAVCARCRRSSDRVPVALLPPPSSEMFVAAMFE
jgi:hypothetical protein